jgi:hypothetical protein
LFLEFLCFWNFCVFGVFVFGIFVFFSTNFSLKNELKSYEKNIAEVLQSCLSRPGLCHVYCFVVYDFPSQKLFDDLRGQMIILSSSCWDVKIDGGYDSVRWPKKEVELIRSSPLLAAIVASSSLKLQPH